MTKGNGRNDDRRRDFQLSRENSTPVRAHILRSHTLTGWHERIKGRWHYRDLVRDPDWRHGWISFDALALHPGDGRIYCGLNSIDGDLLYHFDPSSERFTSLETQRWTDPYDVKIHRTILHNPGDDCLYFGTSLLHDMDQQQEARGGKLVRFDPFTGKYDVLGVPVEKLYIQSIAADFTRNLIYGFTYPAEAFFVFDLATKKSEVLAYTGNSMFLSQPHNPVVDREGWVWGTYAETRAWDETLSSSPIRLFRFHPDERRFVWLDYGLSRKSDPEQLLPHPNTPQDIPSAISETRHTVDHGFCDSMAYDGERYIYAGTVAGVLCRVDTWTNEVHKVAHVIQSGRFPALFVSQKGTIYGAGGMNGHTQIVRWRPATEKIEVFSNLLDPEIDDGPARIHDIVVDRTDRLYLAENDNHTRASYLWTTRLPEAAKDKRAGLSRTSE